LLEVKALIQDDINADANEGSSVDTMPMVKVQKHRRIDAIEAMSKIIGY